VDGFTEGDLDLGQAREFGSDRLDVLGSFEANWHNGCAGSEHEVADPGAASIDPAVTRSGAFGVDPKAVAFGEHLQRSFE